MSTDKPTPYLPPCVLKEELADHFRVKAEWMWSHVITEELLETWGYDIDKVKRLHRLSFFLTRKIYLHFGITDLHEDYSDRIRRELAEIRQSSAA